MALHQQNMEEVADFGAVPDRGAYLFRVSAVEETDKDGNPLMSRNNEPKVIVKAKVQDEGKWIGHEIQMHVSLQPHALATLKALYTACGYKPGREGHDPQNLLDCSFYAAGEPKELETDNGVIKTFNIAPWNIKSVAQGPPKLKN